MEKRLKIIAACGSGMGTSMIIKLKVEKIAKELGISAGVEAMSMGQAKGMERNVDVIICSTHLASEFDHNQSAKILGVVNLMDENEIKTALKQGLNLENN